MEHTEVSMGDNELRPGDACYVGCNKKLYIRYYAYTINGLHYFANNKTEAVSMGRSAVSSINTNGGQHWKCYKKM